MSELVKKVIVAIYVRVSTSKQAEKKISLPDQVKQIIAKVETRNEVVYKIYEEPGSSATDDNRPIFQQMIADAMKKPTPFQKIYVLTTSRFFRDRVGAAWHKKELKKRGVRVVAITQEVSDDPNGHLIEGFYELMDEYESRMNGYHTKRAMKENARQGFINGGMAPFGYKHVKKEVGGVVKTQFEINPKESIVIYKIKDSYVKDGLGCRKITSLLNEQGYKTRKGKPWTVLSVYNVLSSPTYMGTYYFNKRTGKHRQVNPKDEWIPISVPAYWSEDEHKEIKKILASRDPKVTPGKVFSSPLLLSGLLKCSRCGVRMTLETAKSGKHRYYNCGNYLRKRRSVCKGHRIPTHILDKAVLEFIGGKLFTKERLKKLMGELITASGAFQRKAHQQKKLFLNEIRDVQKKLGNLFKHLEEGVVTGEAINDRILELKRREEDLQASMDKIVDIKRPPLHLYKDENIKRFQSIIKEHFTGENNMLAKRYLKLYVKEIIFDGKEVKVVANNQAVMRLFAGEKEKGLETVNASNPKILSNRPITVTSTVLTDVNDWLLQTDSNCRPSG